MSHLLAYGGVLVDGGKLRSLTQAVDGIATKYGVPAKEEVKWSPRKGSWIHDNLKDDNRLGCYSEILQAAAAHECKAVVALCDYEMRGLPPNWGFERCVEYALERVSTHLIKQRLESVIISDRPSGGHREADDFLAAFSERLVSEYNHMESETFALNMLTAQSHMVRALQIADLVVAITAAMFSGQTKWAAQYFDLVRPMFIRNALGYIGGTGVKVYPDELINLYYWVLSERQYSKAGRGVAYPMPIKHFLFRDNDGL